MLRHIDCCLCKNIYLPVDEKKGRAKTDALRELSHRFAAASATSYYCVETGLVRIPKSVRCTRSELQRLEQRIFGGSVPPTKLVALRGSRQDVSTAAHHETANGEEEQLDIIGVDSENLLNTSLGSSAGTDRTVMVDDPTDSNNTSFDYACDSNNQHMVEADETSSNDNNSNNNSEAAAAVAVAQLHASFPCSSSATLEFCPFGPSASSSSSSSSRTNSAQDLELGTTGAPTSSLTNNKEVVSERSKLQGILRQSPADSSCGSDELVSASEYLEHNHSAVVGDNRCRIIDSYDESDGVEVSATTSQSLTDVEAMLRLSSTSSSNRSEDDGSSSV